MIYFQCIILFDDEEKLHWVALRVLDILANKMPIWRCAISCHIEESNDIFASISGITSIFGV
jgi:hypothetical protein